MKYIMGQVFKEIPDRTERGRGGGEARRGMIESLREAESRLGGAQPRDRGPAVRVGGAAGPHSRYLSRIIFMTDV